MTKRNKSILFVAAAVVIVATFIFTLNNKESDTAFYERDLHFPENMPENVRKDVQTKIDESIVLIKQNSDDFNAWYDLGLYYKTLNDYEGARLVWEHAVEIRPQSYLPRLALADLYGYFLRDQAKAEFYYKDAIEKDPKEPFSYFQAALYYRDVLHDIPKAKEVTTAGVLANPDSKDLVALKKELDQAK